jgi:hypothetical protein
LMKGKDKDYQFRYNIPIHKRRVDRNG